MALSLTFNNTFLLLLQIVLILLHGAHTRAMDKLLKAADETSTHVVPRKSIINVEKDLYGGVPAVAAQVENTGIGGRKAMMFKRILGEAKEEGLNNMNGGQYPKIISTSAASAHNSVGNRNLKVRLRSSNAGPPRDHRRAKKVKRAGFIPFNADYYVPKPHPPKNN